MSKERNYQQGKIYRVVDNAYQMCYIGSTIENLASRMNSHKAKYKKFKQNGEGGDTTIYRIFDAFGVSNCKIELIELYPCNSKIELLAREGHHQRQEECVNKQIAGRTKKEWANDNREKVQQQVKQWADEHQEALKTYREEYYEKNKERILEQCKVYRENNKETKQAKDKAYRDKHKEQLRQKEKQPYHCQCGCVVQISEKARHQKSMKHQRLLRSLV